MASSPLHLPSVNDDVRREWEEANDKFDDRLMKQSRKLRSFEDVERPRTHTMKVRGHVQYHKIKINVRKSKDLSRSRFMKMAYSPDATGSRTRKKAKKKSTYACDARPSPFANTNAHVYDWSVKQARVIHRRRAPSPRRRRRQQNEMAPKLPHILQQKQRRREPEQKITRRERQHRQQQRMRQQHNIAAQSKTNVGTAARQVTVKKEISSSKRSVTGARNGVSDSTITAAPGSNLALAAAGLFDILNLIQPLVVEAANACEYLPRVRRVMDVVCFAF